MASSIVVAVPLCHVADESIVYTSLPSATISPEMLNHLGLEAQRDRDFMPGGLGSAAPPHHLRERHQLAEVLRRKLPRVRICLYAGLYPIFLGGGVSDELRFAFYLAVHNVEFHYLSPDEG